jgi:EAL domain-containing protein (putative c-di-GMP-specific phosphodiesterase class I)
MRERFECRLSALSEARRALDNDEIVPFYQPIVSLQDGAVEGFEALLRWRHPERGILGPAALLGAFEDEVLGFELGRRMLDRIVEDAATWRDMDAPFQRVGLNLSQSEFRSADLVGQILDRLSSARLPTRHLLIEVTESTLLGRDADSTARKIRELHDHGILIALDDFGTGYASLTHLKQFPVDIIKIDR